MDGTTRRKEEKVAPQLTAERRKFFSFSPPDFLFLRKSLHFLLFFLSLTKYWFGCALICAAGEKDMR